MTKGPLKPQLWTPRPVEETVQVYRDWAETYDLDVEGHGYRTPGRIADLLCNHLEPDAPILDFGCGTGISGAALKRAGFTTIDGTDITDAMVEQARTKDIYRRLWVGRPGDVPAEPGTYAAIVAAGVVSLGAAPPETLGDLIAASAPGGLVAFSFNDPTLEDGSYVGFLDARIADGAVEQVARAHGPHFADMQMGSDVILLRRL